MFGCVNIDENGLLHKIYADISLQHIFITYAHHKTKIKKLKKVKNHLNVDSFYVKLCKIEKMSVQLNVDLRQVFV